jgi:hypothetical protein
MKHVQQEQNQRGFPTGDAVPPRSVNQARPEWTDCKGITRIFGIGKSTIYRLEAEGKIRTSSLRERNKLRGKKLINCDSVAAFIEKMASGGEGAQS